MESFVLDIENWDKDGKRVTTPFTIKVNKVKDISEHGIGWKKSKYSISYTLTIPTHIHNKILGKTVPTQKNFNHIEVNYDPKYSKYITATSLETICDKFWDICQSYIWILNQEKRKLEKVIYFEYNGDVKSASSIWNGINVGTVTKIGFNYFIGFISEDKKNRYNEEKRMISTYHDAGKYNYNYITWSEEREQLFVNIKENFESFINKFLIFTEKINENDVDMLITNNSFLKQLN
jgi:hypothetical protein